MITPFPFRRDRYGDIQRDDYARARPPGIPPTGCYARHPLQSTSPQFAPRPLFAVRTLCSHRRSSPHGRRRHCDYCTTLQQSTLIRARPLIYVGTHISAWVCDVDALTQCATYTTLPLCFPSLRVMTRPLNGQRLALDEEHGPCRRHNDGSARKSRFFSVMASGIRSVRTV